jgi:hypothetical protein
MRIFQPFIGHSKSLTSHRCPTSQSSSSSLRTAHGRRFRVLDLEPVRRAAGTVGRPEALRYDALAAERDRVLENLLAISLIERDAGVGPIRRAGACGPRWLGADVVAVHFE